MPLDLPAVDAADLPEIQAILADRLADPAASYAPHPGDLAWWFYHQDPRHPPLESFVMGDACAVIDRHDGELDVFHRPGADPAPALERGLETIGEQAVVGWVSPRDADLTGLVGARGFVPDEERDVEFARPVEPMNRRAMPGIEIRPLRGEEEAPARRAASHAAFGSTMDPEAHLARYLRFMRSPAYSAERDLVAVTADGSIASFLIWWPDAMSGIAQLEPVGTHPAYQGRGLATAVFARALADMRAAGMHTVRVATPSSRVGAVAYYESVGFSRIDELVWWRAGA
ncbi:MAG: hypothetical protein A2Z12_03370 [Actinobacteria bacterium RBG_16_68_21]|nr:MAG: hypothetical protein A2Z12_03370 [Actinobacteria bacterium RBG_16_68_21]